VAADFGSRNGNDVTAQDQRADSEKNSPRASPHFRL
jgi:hypothetical protein